MVIGMFVIYSVVHVSMLIEYRQRCLLGEITEHGKNRQTKAYLIAAHRNECTVYYLL